MIENEKILRKMSIGDILDYSIEIYKRNFKKLTLLVLICYLPVTLLSTLISGNMLSEQMSMYKQIFSGIFNGNSDLITTPPNQNFSSNYMIYSILSNILQLIMLAYGFTVKLAMDRTIIKIVYYDAVYQKSEDMFSTLKESFSKLGGLVLNKILYWLIVGGIYVATTIIAIIPMVVIVVIMADTTRFNLSSEPIFIITMVGIAVLFGIGFVFLANYFSLRFLFGKHAVVIENTSGVNSIARSWRLTKGSFWHAAASSILGASLFYFIPFIFTSASLAIAVFNKNLFIVAFVLSQLIGSIVYPYLWTLTTMIFINLKIRREGLDLEVKVDKMLQEQLKADILNDEDTVDEK